MGKMVNKCSKNWINKMCEYSVFEQKHGSKVYPKTNLANLYDDTYRK